MHRLCFGFALYESVLEDLITMLYETLIAICYYFYNLQFKKVKDTERGVLILVKLNVTLLHECVSLFLNGTNVDNLSENFGVRNSYPEVFYKKKKGVLENS